MTSRGLALVVGSLIVLGSPSTGAQPEPRDFDAALARERFERGVRLMESQDWAAALEQLEESFRLRPTQVALFDIGLCLKSLDRPGEAIAAFERLVTEFADRGTEARVALARAELESIRAATGTVELRVSVPGAEVLVDGAARGAAPLAGPLVLVAGTHLLQARREGYEPVQRSVAVIAGTGISIDLVLHPVAVPEPAAPVAAPVGPPPARLRAPPAPSRGLRPVWFWSAVAVTGAAAVTTAILGGLVVAGDADYRASRPRLASDREDGRRLALLTDIALGVSVAAAITATLLYARTELEPAAVDEARADLRVSLSARPGALSVGLGGGF